MEYYSEIKRNKLLIHAHGWTSKSSTKSQKTKEYRRTRNRPIFSESGMSFEGDERVMRTCWVNQIFDILISVLVLRLQMLVKSHRVYS